MNPNRRESLRHALRRLVDAQAAIISIIEEAYALLSDELALDPLDFFSRHFEKSNTERSTLWPLVDRPQMSVTYRGRFCFLGNTLALRLLDRLARRPNRYIPYEELLTDVWEGGTRTDSAVRSVVRDLRRRLRVAGLTDLAAAIDGSVSGHYALRLRSE